MIYRDREEAGELLAEALRPYAGRNPLVLAIPRGAVPMGRVIADRLGGELDVVLVHKLGAPGQPELAVGAIDEEGQVHLNEGARLLHIGRDFIEQECRRQREVLGARRARYTPDRPPISPAGRTVIVLDDGIATGATMIAALRAIRRRGPAELVAAAAVMPPETRERIEREADRVVCLETPEFFAAVGQFFENFDQVSDDDVVAVLAAAGPATREPSVLARSPVREA
jgi:predicted phosphoribosyltransferase